MTLASDSGYISSRHVDSAMNRIPHQDRIRSRDFVVTWRVHCSTDCLPYDPSPIVFGFAEYAHERTRTISHNVTRTNVIDSSIHSGETIFLGYHIDPWKVSSGQFDNITEKLLFRVCRLKLLVNFATSHFLYLVVYERL